MSWTAYWMLRWYTELEADPALLAYAQRYANRLLQYQRPDGGFPSWVDGRTGAPSLFLEQSAQMAMHVLFLSLLYRVQGDRDYLSSAQAAAEYIAREIVPCGRWEDFETYYSCAPENPFKKAGTPDPKSGLYNQCNLSIFWTAAGMLELYRATGNTRNLDVGLQALGELCLYQQVWDPPSTFLPSADLES